MKSRIIKLKNYQHNVSLVHEIMFIIEPSYKTAGTHIAKDIEICNELYAVYTEHEKLIAFFMVGYHDIGNIPSCYLGLSACREEYKNNGFVKALYLEFAKDCIKKEEENGKPILCYWTTATPIVYHWFCKNFKDVQPSRNGKCTNEAKEMLTIIAKTKYAKASFDIEYPFVLRHAAQQINYSDTERERIKEAIKTLGLTVFDQYKLDENNGDRFLMMGYVPQNNELTDNNKL